MYTPDDYLHINAMCRDSLRKAMCAAEVDYWTISSFNSAVQHHRSKAEWVLVNGIWHKREGIMRKC